MPLQPQHRRVYHVFLASPGDVATERNAVRHFFDGYNRDTAHLWGARFEVIDWESHVTTGAGRPQALITKQTLEKYRPSLALVIGIMNQRFGTPSGAAESGTEEEFHCAMRFREDSGGEFPEIKWFFRKVDQFTAPSDPAQLMPAVEQWQKVLAFKKRMQDLKNPIFYTEYPSPDTFPEVLRRDLNLWLSDNARPWAEERAAQLSSQPDTATPAPPTGFDREAYRQALLKQFDKLNFDLLDTTGANYNAVRLWSVFVPQSVRECHQFNPRLLEIPKDQQKRMLEAGEISAEEFERARAEAEAEQLREAYFNQPLRPVLEVAEAAFATPATQRVREEGHKLVILGDPGSGKSSLIRYLALRWADLAEPAAPATPPIPLVIELRLYGPWQCQGQKGFVRYLEEAPYWHEWSAGLLENLLTQPGVAVLLLDGLDEIFDPAARQAVVHDIQRFAGKFPHVPILLTSRAVGYQAQPLRDAGFRHFMLQDLDSAQIAAFIARWHEETFDDPDEATPKRERLQKAIHDSRPIAQLAGNPLLLTLMAILNRHQELPRDRTDLYAQASRLLLHQWDTERALSEFPGLRTDIGPREKTEILRRVAAHMQASPSGLKGNLIDGETLTGLIEGYLKDELSITPARGAAHAVVKQLRERNFILCFLGADSYAFVHRTFLEYFCAVEFVHQFNVSKELDIHGLLALFEAHCHEDEWREVLRLICGQIDEKFAGQIIERLIALADIENWDGESSLPELLLAIECLIEVQNTNRLAREGSNLLMATARCFLDGIDPSGDFILDIVCAARELGTRWPGKESFSFADLSPSSGHVSNNHYFLQWPEFLAGVFGKRSWIEKLLEDRNWEIRWGAMGALIEMWPDDSTRKHITKRAIQDKNQFLRSGALEFLAKTWPDASTLGILLEQTTKDPSFDARGSAFRAASKMHSEFGHLLATRDLSGRWPFLDPLKPISRGHIELAASESGTPPDEIDATVASLSAFLGWDVTKGASSENGNQKS